MRRLPYGYCVIRGEIAVDDEKAARLRRFFSLYISGLSINKAKCSAGVDMSSKTCRTMLTNRTYLGTDRLPRILDDQILEEAARAVQCRGRHLVGKTGQKVQELPVRTTFVVAAGEPLPDDMDATAYAQWLYSRIQPVRAKRTRRRGKG